MVFTIGSSPSSLMTIWGSWSKFSHVLMVDRDPSNPEMPAFLWESVSQPDDLVDVHTQSNIKKGVRLVLATERLIRGAQRDGKSSVVVGVVRLNMPVTGPTPPPAMRLAVYRAMSKLQGTEYPKPYENDVMNLVAVQYNALVGENLRDNSEYFCSELMAETYRMLRIIREDTNTSMISPKNLAEHLNAITCINGFSLGPHLCLYTLDIAGSIQPPPPPPPQVLIPHPPSLLPPPPLPPSVVTILTPISSSSAAAPSSRSVVLAASTVLPPSGRLEL
jgi:hypothetical protein